MAMVPVDAAHVQFVASAQLKKIYWYRLAVECSAEDEVRKGFSTMTARDAFDPDTYRGGLYIVFLFPFLALDSAHRLWKFSRKPKTTNVVVMAEWLRNFLEYHWVAEAVVFGSDAFYYEESKLEQLIRLSKESTTGTILLTKQDLEVLNYPITRV